MEIIVKLCKAHPGLQVDIDHAEGRHGGSHRLDFYYDKSLDPSAAIKTEQGETAMNGNNGNTTSQEEQQ